MSHRLQVYASLLLTLYASASLAEKIPATDQEKFSYAFGVQVLNNILEEGIQFDPDSFIQALDDGLHKKTMKLSMQDMQQILLNYKKQQSQKLNALATANKVEGEKFLADNKTKPGVITLPSGLQYKIIKEGTGYKPSLQDTVTAHYEGSLLGGQVFDSSYKRGQPLQLHVNGVIKGWQEILPLMSVGSKWQVFIPSSLAYGEDGAGSQIGPNATLIFTIELVSIDKT